jgi:hypothetical protein
MNLATKDTISRVTFASDVSSSTWRERTLLLVGVTTLLRVVIARETGLSNTEAYYTQWARFPALSYYDHPPLVAWTTWLIQRATVEPWAVRVVPILCGAALSGLVYRLGERLFSPRAGFLSVVVATTVPAIAFMGVLVNPEGLLAPLWVLFLLLLDDLREREEPWRPLAVGAVIGVAFLAKYTAILGVPVAVLYVAGSRSTRRWLRRPSFYLAGALALVIAAPVVAWNYEHAWPSVQLHLAERMVRPPGETLVGALARVGTGQLITFHPLLLPAFFGLLAYSLWCARNDERYRLLATASLPVLAFLLVMMVRAGDSEPHWTLVGYVPLAVVAGGAIDESVGRFRRFATLYLRASISLSAAVGALYSVHLRSPAVMDAFPSYDPAADPMTETIGWERVSAAIGVHAARLGPGTVVAGAHNTLCGHLQAAIDDTPAVYCASSRRTEFDFVGRRSPPEGAPVVFVSSDRYPDDPALALPQYRCTRAQDVDVERGGHLLARYRIHECRPRERPDRNAFGTTVAVAAIATPGPVLASPSRLSSAATRLQ